MKGIKSHIILSLQFLNYSITCANNKKGFNTMDIDGIESNYIYIDKNNIRHDDIDKWNKFAKKHNLETSTGSDFHNEDGIHPTIGLINE